MSPRRNWNSPTPLAASECALPPQTKGWGGTRETERGGPCRPIETEVNRDSGSTYGRVSFLGYLPKTGGVIGSLHKMPHWMVNRTFTYALLLRVYWNKCIFFYFILFYFILFILYSSEKIVHLIRILSSFSQGQLLFINDMKEGFDF